MTLSLKVLPVGVFLVAMVLAKLIAVWLPIMLLPELVTWLGVALTLVAGLVFGLAGVQLFYHYKTTVDPVELDQASWLVTTGIYRYSRNPMYLGLLCCLLAWMFYLQTISAFVMAPLFVWYMTQFQIKAEETVLTRLFGSDYIHYQQRVRRWL